MSLMGEKTDNRSLCVVRVSESVSFLTCTRCASILRTEGDDATGARQIAFDNHRCEDFPRDEGVG